MPISILGRCGKAKAIETAPARLAAWTVLWAALALFVGSANANPQTFAFVGPDNVITAEVAGEYSFVVNFINLSDYVHVIQPSDFIYRGASGQRYIGQVYELEHHDSLGIMQKYSASTLVKGHSSSGLNIVGLFREKDAIEELSIRIGSRRFYMQGLEKSPFEELMRKIGELDLDSTDTSAMFEALNIRETGYVKSTDGTAAWNSDWEGLVVDGVNPPRAIETPPIFLPRDGSKSKGDVTIKVSCLINQNGGIENLKVVKGVNRKLDQKALDGVTNSWVFLPATRNGEVYEALLEFNVILKEQAQTP
jgi:hypothetical protein